MFRFIEPFDLPFTVVAFSGLLLGLFLGDPGSEALQKGTAYSVFIQAQVFCTRARRLVARWSMLSAYGSAVLEDAAAAFRCWI